MEELVPRSCGLGADLFELIVEHAGLEAYLVRRDGSLAYVSPAAADSLGYTVGEMLELGVPGFDLGFGPVFASHFDQLKCSNMPVFETVHRAKDGRLVPKEMKSVYIRLGDEEYVCGFGHDITERKQQEALARLNESRLESLLALSQMTEATVPDIAAFAMEEAVRLTQSKIGYIAFTNADETLLTMHAWSRSAMAECSIAGKPILYPVADTGLWGEAVRQRRPVITNDYAAPSPWKRGIPEGHVVVRRHMNVPVFDGDHIVIVAGVGNKETEYDDTDVRQLALLMAGMWHIVQRARADQALRESEDRYRTLFEAESDAIVIVDVETLATVESNPAALDMYGYSADEMATISALQLSAEPEETLSLIRTGSGLVRVTLGHHRRKDGTTFPVEISARFFELGGRRRLLWAMRDITQRLRAQEERARLEAQLAQSQRMESVGRLAGGVAHDFNNMLQVIQGQAHLAMAGMDPQDPLYHQLERICGAAERSAALTRQLLTFARRQAVTPAALDLNEAIAGLQDMLRRLIREDLDLVWIPGPGLWNVWADPSQIDQIVANLVVNARDAIEGSGTITIETRNALVGAGGLEGRPHVAPGEYVAIEVRDTGCGVAPEDVPHVFEPFYTTKAPGHGTGLGLSTVYGIAEQNGGFVEIISTPGAGATFRVCLPRSATDAPTAATRNPETEVAAGRATILVVEDEAAVLEVVQAVLRLQGYAVIAVSDPVAAEAEVASHRGTIDLVISDVVMPGVNGRELERQLRAAGVTAPFLFMSGYPADVLAVHGVADRGVELIQKPFTASALAAKVRELLARA